MAFWKLHKVMDETGLGRSTIYDYVKKGQFPPPVRIGDKAVAWVDQEVMDWGEARIKTSRESMS